MLGDVFKSIKRFWKYLTAKLNMSFDEKADPKVQLEQANASAAEVISVALSALPARVASSAISTAWRALADSFSRSVMRASRR